MIGKILADRLGWTKKLGGTENEIVHITTKVKDKELDKLKKDIQDCNTTAQVDVVIKEHGLSNIKGLPEHIKEVYEKGEIDKLKLSDVNKFAITQRYNDIANQAHGFLGVKKAINEYNEGIKNGTLNAEKFTETISQSNSSLGKYLTNLKGADAGIFSYGKSLATATLKTFALETATMALNTATSLGVSFLISAGLSALTSFIDNIIVTKEEIKEAGEAARNTIDEIITNFDNLKKETDDVKVRFANLAQGVDNLGKVNQSRGKLTTDDYEEFLDLSNQLADLFPQLKIGYDDNGNAILDLSGNVDTIVGSLNSLVEVQKKLANQKIMEEMPDVWAEYKSDLKDYNEELGESQKKQKGYDNALKKLSENRKFEYVQDYDKTDGGFESSDRAIMKTLEDLGHKSYNYFTQEEWGNGRYKINWDLSSLSENEFGKIVNRLQTLAKDYKEEADFTKGEIESANSKITNYINTWLSDEWNYDKLSPDMKKVAKDALVNSNWVDQLPDSIDTSDWDEVSVWLQQNFLHAIYEIDDQGIKTALNGVLTDNFTVDSLHGIIESLIKTQGFSKDNPLIIYLQSKIDGKKDAEEKYKNTLTEAKHKLGGYNHDEKGYETNNEAGNKLDQFWKENVLTEEDVDLWSEVTEGITDSTKALNAFINAKKGISEVPKTFAQAWKSIGTSGDEKADKKAKEVKEELLELAKAGKLTEKAFSKSNIAENFLKQTKLSAEEATQEINKLVSSADQLSSMKTGISSISSILGERESGSDIGIDTLKGMPEDVKAQTKEYEHFVEVLSTGSSSMDECQDAANKLATAYVNSNNFLSNLTKENEEYYKSVLREMGVKNAANIVEDTLIAKKQTHNLKTKALAAATEDMGKKTNDATDEFLKHATMSDLAKVKLVDLIATERIFSSTSLSTSDKVTELNKLAMSYLGVSNAIQISSAMGSDSRYWNSQEDYDKAVLKQWNKTIKKQTKLVVTGVDVKAEKSSSNSGSGKGKKEKTKSAKQQFDWINRALDRLSSRLDLVKSKYDNLFNNKKAKDSEALLKRQTKNLKDQYRILKKTAKYQERAQKKYSAKSKKVKISKNKKENASLKKAVRQGRIKGSMKDLIATYGEKKATKIQKYQDWYDKAREAEKNKISAQKAARETRIQNYQNMADNADEKRSLAQTQKENATTATSKNDFIKKEKESVEASYNYQIKIANLKRDSLKVDQLRVEKAKELRDLEIEQHQNLADEHQAVLDQYSAEKELAAKASEKNAIITQEEAKTRELYAEKITIAGLEGNSSEQKRLEAELNKQLRDFDVERHQNLADEYQSELDKSSAEKANLTTANKKNAIVEKEKALTKQLYAEKIAIAYIEGKISEGEQLQEELARQMVIIEKEKFDNIAHYYENLMKLKNNSYTNLSNTADEIEARGLIVGASLYNSQIRLNNKKKAGYEEELKLLESQLPQIKEGTDEWYDAQDAIQSCKNGIAETTKNTIELNKAIREVPFLLNEKISTRLQLVSSEFELINKFMSNKKMFNDKTGNFTEEGTATLASYYNQLLLAQKETKNTKTALDDMLAAIERGDKGYEDKELAMQEYYERYDEYLKLAGTELDIQQKLIDMMKEKYQAELNYLKDIIDKRKELLDTEKEAYDYQKTIEEKTKNISSLAKQLEASKGDDSEAGRLKLQQLQVSLDEARQDLQDTEYDKWISDQKEMLDKLYNDYSAFIDDHMNDTDALLREAIKYLEDPATKKEFLDTWDTYMAKHGFDPENDLAAVLNELGKDGSIVSAIHNLSDIIIHYYEMQQKTSETIYKNSPTGNSETNSSNAIDGIIGIVDSPPQQSTPSPVVDQNQVARDNVKNWIVGNKNNANFWEKIEYKKASDTQKKIHDKIYDPGKGKRYMSATGMYALQKYLKVPNLLQYLNSIGYSSGGFVDTLQKIPAMNGDDGWATLKRGEAVLTPEQTKQFQKLAENLDVLNSAVNILPNLQKQSHSFVPNYNSTQTIGDVNIQMEFPNVTNYEDFRHKLQSDPKIEKYVKSVIWDKGDLSKYKINM